MQFREIVKRELKKQGKTQKWLSEEIGSSPSGLQSLFSNPTLDSIRRIDAVLPLPEAAALLHTRDFLNGYLGKGDVDPLFTAILRLKPEYQKIVAIMVFELTQAQEAEAPPKSKSIDKPKAARPMWAGYTKDKIDEYFRDKYTDPNYGDKLHEKPGMDPSGNGKK